MDIKDFLLARIAEDEWAVRDVINRTHVSFIDGYRMAGQVGRHDPARVLRECAAKRAIIRQHEAWPVLVEQPLEFTDRVDDGNNVIFQASRKMAWLTDREYVKRFGEQPPTAPMLRTLAAIYSDHPDYQDGWKP